MNTSQTRINKAKFILGTIARSDAICDRKHGWMQGQGKCVRAKKKALPQVSRLMNPIKKSIDEYNQATPEIRRQKRIKAAQVMALLTIGAKALFQVKYNSIGKSHYPHGTISAGDPSLLPSDDAFFSAKLEPLVLGALNKPLHKVYQTEIDGVPYFVKESPSVLAASEVAAKRFADELGLGDHVLPVKAIYDKREKKSFVVCPLVPGLKTIADQFTFTGEPVDRVDIKINDDMVSKMVTFDHIVGNPDRHMNNIGYTPHGSILLIDHGYSFGNEKFFHVQAQQNLPLLGEKMPLLIDLDRSLMDRAKDPAFEKILDESFKDLPPAVASHAKFGLFHRVRKQPSFIEKQQRKIIEKAFPRSDAKTGCGTGMKGQNGRCVPAEKSNNKVLSSLKDAGWALASGGATYAVTGSPVAAISNALGTIAKDKHGREIEGDQEYRNKKINRKKKTMGQGIKSALSSIAVGTAVGILTASALNKASPTLTRLKEKAQSVLRKEMI